MAKPTTLSLPQSIDETLDLLAGADYVADRALATVLFLALRMKRPLFLEGEAGVGKTEIAKVLASALGRRLIRLQCYEGLDVASAVYEWNYAAQMIEIRMEEASGAVDRKDMERNVFSEKYLIRRPVLEALTGKAGAAPVFLIDELDRTDEAFEAFLLEILSDFQVTVPERILAERLASRGRESPDDIAGRLARAAAFQVEGSDVLTLVNDGPLARSVESFVAALRALPDNGWRRSSRNGCSRLSCRNRLMASKVKPGRRAGRNIRRRTGTSASRSSCGSRPVSVI